jgi:beta propeller repeat protein
LKRPKLIGLLTIIFLVFAFYGGLIIKPANAAVKLQFGENQITSNSAIQKNPDIYEYGLNNYAIVWEDNRNGNWEIYMFYQKDLGNGNWDVRPEVRLTTNPASDENPRIFNDRIVYQSDRNGNWDIYMYNITSNTETQITNNTAHQTSPAVDGNYIVWQDNRRGQWDIYMFDLTTQSERQVTSTDDNYNPEISGNRIVYRNDYAYEGWRGGQVLNSEICWYEISTGQSRVIDFGERGKVADPAIDGNNIAWARSPYYEWDIFLYNASTCDDFWHTTSYAQHQQPEISGQYVVNTDDRNGNLEIYISDFVAGQEFRVTNNNATQNSPKISAEYGGFIVYNDNRNGNGDIYLTSFWSTTIVGATGPNTQSTPSSSLGNTVDSDNSGLITILVSATAVVVVSVVGAAVFMAKRRKPNKDQLT